MLRPSLRRRMSAEHVVAWSVTTTVTLFVLWQMAPELVLRDTTPVEGDLAGHLQTSRFLREHLLPHGRLVGWSPDWFTGYPLFTFYFPLGSLLVALVDLLLPFTVALKLVVAAGPVALPLCAYAFGRLNRCDRLTSGCLAVAVLPLLLLSTLFYAGGSIAATAGGEYTYGLALPLGLLVVGLARRGLRTGRHRALTAALLAVCLLVHLIPTVMVVVAIVVATVLRPAWAKLRWSGPVLVVAGLLVAFWAVPFLLHTQFTAGIEDPKATPLLQWLFPAEMIPVVPFALLAAVTRPPDDSEDSDLRLFLLAMTAVSGLVFAAVPTGRVWNGRFLAVWFLWLCLLGGYGLARLARIVDDRRQRRSRGRPLDAPALARLLVPAVAVVALLPLYDSRDWRGVLTPAAAPGQASMAETRFGGLERSPSRAEYREFIDKVRTVAREHGCGRLHVETSAGSWADLRLPFVWLSPQWTDDCITTTTGLYVQSSATSPSVVNTAFRLSSASGPPERGGRFDLAAGVAGLRSLGVRYFVATTLKTAQAADVSPELQAVAQTKSYGDGFWKFYEVSGVELVEPLELLPVVVPGSGRSRTSWEAATSRWFDTEDTEVVVAASGPAAWPRRDRVSADPPRRPVAQATVSDVRIGHDGVSFQVSRTGVPVLVKVSYFPNWQASGADGPWRVTPNEMVVVPTSRKVSLQYGRTPVDNAGLLATLGGLAGLALLARRGPVKIPVQSERQHPPDQPTLPPRSKSKAKKRRR